VRDRVVQALEHIGANSDKNIAALVAGLKDGDTNVRKGTITALTDPQNGIGAKPGVVKAVIALMQKEGGARGPGGDVLGSAKFTQNGANQESVPALIAMLKDKDEGVRSGGRTPSARSATRGPFLSSKRRCTMIRRRFGVS